MRVKFIVLVLLQVLLLAGIIAYRESRVSSGERVLLRTVPVDPRDIFRGDYVSLVYEISTLDLDELGVKAIEPYNRNEKVYVLLEKKDDGTFVASSVSKSIPSGRRFIQGRSLGETTSSKWEVSIKEASGNIRTLNPRWFSGINKGALCTFCIDESNNVRHFFKIDQNENQKCSSGNPVS